MTEERAHHACAKIHKPQRARARISPLSLHFHIVQFRSAGEKHAFLKKNIINRRKILNRGESNYAVPESIFKRQTELELSLCT